MISFFKNILVRVCFAALTVLLIFFIFYMSAQNADDSSALSLRVLLFLNSLLSQIGLKGFLTEHIVRKAAHFTEYFVLGGLLFADVMGFVQRKRINIALPPCIAFVVAILDEMSQSLSMGRTPMARDVLIDFMGALSAVIIIQFLLYIFVYKNKKLSRK